MLVTVLTGENGSTAGGADRISDKAAVETNSFPSQPVQVRRLNKTTTVGAIAWQAWSSDRMKITLGLELCLRQEMEEKTCGRLKVPTAVSFKKSRRFNLSLIFLAPSTDNYQIK
jgi:hypothetical protein